jgi:hypothetical protein
LADLEIKPAIEKSFHYTLYPGENEAGERAGKPESMKKYLSHRNGYVILRCGEMSEWSNVPLSKSGRVKALVGSNPTLSAYPGGVS